MLSLILQTLWLLLPAGIANMAPVIFKWVPFLNHPVDFNKTLSGKPIFGKNKTFRGFFFGTLSAIATVLIQAHFAPQVGDISIIDYSTINPYLLGFLLGFGALLGDIIESFFKRRTSIAPGKSWVGFDQLDWIIGSLFLASFYISIPWQYILSSLIIFGLLHPTANLLGYYLKLKENKF